MAAEKDTIAGGKISSSNRAYEMLRDRLLRFAILPNQLINEVTLAA